MDKQQALATNSLFQGLPDNQLNELLNIVIEKVYSRGESIFFEGDEGNGFYLVMEGKVKIYKMSFQGKEQILHIFGPGEPFGEVPVFHGNPFPANAESLVKSRLLFFPRREFVQLVTENPAIALNMLAMLSMRLRRFAAQIESLSLKEVPARLATYLLYLAEEQKNKECVELEISKGQLASLLGTIPETLSRMLGKMSEEGLIEVQGRKIKLLDLKGLEERQ